MKHPICLTLLLFFTLSLSAQNNTKNVLFIGNSITYYNNMPFTFEAIANSKGDQTSVTMYAPGGTGFVNHVNDPNVYAKFKEKVWDFVVLQPGSGESAGTSQPIATTLNRARQLKDSIIKYSPCAKILFYEISNGVHGSSASDLTQYNNVMDVIRTNLETLADGTDLYFAPVGEAFREKWNNDQTDMLWGSTGNIHPNAKGSYLAACVFYASIYQKPSAGTNEISSLSQTDATALQQLADNKVLQHKVDWRINVHNLYTDFDFNINGLQVTFNNLSANADSVSWDFGDGNSSTNTQPVHTYTTNGNYQVTLTTTKGNCDESVTKTMAAGSSAINTLADTNFVIYPNPANDKLLIETPLPEKYSFELMDITGKILMTTTENNINVASFNTGVYLIRITDTQTRQSTVKRWLKK